MIYTKLPAYPAKEEFICRAAETVKLASKKLIEAGFEYITNINSIRPFRKHKSFVKGSWSIEKGLWSSLVKDSRLGRARSWVQIPAAPHMELSCFLKCGETFVDKSVSIVFHKY